MNRKKSLRDRRRLLLTLLALPWAGAHAADIRIVHSSVAPSGRNAMLRKLLVLGWGTRQDLRQPFEDAVAKALSASGLQAVAAHTRMPAGSAVLREAVTRVVKAEGYDGVLVARLIATELAPAAAPADRIAPTLEHNLKQLETPSAPVEDGKVAVTETSLYRASDGLKIWSAVTDVHNPRDLAKTTREFALLMVDALRADKLI